MAEKRKLEFFLLRYVPDAVKGEFVNFGLVFIETSSVGAGFADVRFTQDWRRLLCLDPKADLDVLQAIERDILQRVVEVRNCEEIMRVLNDSFSNVIQLSGAQGCLTDDPVKEIEEMAGYYLESAKLVRSREVSAREKIAQAMRDAWESEGISWKLKPFPVAHYTKPGDKFVFDFGYFLGNEIKLFQAVSLRARVDNAVKLAARYPKIAEAMRSHEKFPVMPTLTAIVDDDLNTQKEEIGFALGMMRESDIQVSEVREMPRIAANARRELGA